MKKYLLIGLLALSLGKPVWAVDTITADSKVKTSENDQQLTLDEKLASDLYCVHLQINFLNYLEDYDWNEHIWDYSFIIENNVEIKKLWVEIQNTIKPRCIIFLKTEFENPKFQKYIKNTYNDVIIWKKNLKEEKNICQVIKTSSEINDFLKEKLEVWQDHIEKYGLPNDFYIKFFSETSLGTKDIKKLFSITEDIGELDLSPEGQKMAVLYHIQEWKNHIDSATRILRKEYKRAYKGNSVQLQE